jgi:hypothetical protein
MRKKPRPTLRLRKLVSLALIVALFPALALSQQRGRAKPPTPAAQSKNAERARRLQAINLLIETADSARTFDDLFYRARVQTLAADTLWPYDAVQARAIFRRAWEAATASDKAEQEETARETGALPGAVQKITDARDEVLAKAAARDARLAEIFLRDLSSQKDKRGANPDDAELDYEMPLTDWHEASTNGARRLALASGLLEAGETRRAVEIAAPVINEGTTKEIIEFILRLRQRNVSDADALYLRLLERVAADPHTDANAVLLLSSPIISPKLLVAVDRYGALQFRAVPLAKASIAAQQAVNPKAQTAFFNLAAAVLLRPLSYNVTGPPMAEVQEWTARFYAIGRLAPFFENSSAPYAVYAPALRARQSELFNELEVSSRERVSSQFDINSMTRDAGYVDPLRKQSEELTHAADSSERASLALSIVKTAVRNKFWDRARRAAAEIEDEGQRKSALTFIQVHQIKDILVAYEDEKDDDFESVAKFVREADVPPFAKAWGLAQTAIIAARKRDARTPQNVSELLNEAESHAARVAQGTPERVAAYGVITTAAARTDATRAWELLRELVKAANAVEDFTGDDVSLSLSADADLAGEAEDAFNVEAEVFRLDGIFATMAHLDFEKALAEARALDGDVPQAFATIAIAKSRIQNPEVRSQNKN